MSNEENKLKFESLVRKIRRDGADIDGFLSMLESSDFYSAPATTQFHWSFEGGLCEHTMDVYDQLVKQVSIHHGSVENSPYSQDTLILVAISHDLYKITTNMLKMKRCIHQLEKNLMKWGDLIGYQALHIK